MKIFYMGKQLRDSKGRFTKRLFKNIFILTILCIVGFAAIEYFYPTTVYINNQIDISEQSFAEKIDGLKDDVISKLAACESAGYSEDAGIIIFDSNNKASIGQLQFQKATVIHYYKVLYGKDITPKEAVLIALDTDRASSLAKDIAFKTKNKIGKDWFNCNKKLGLDAQVALIQKLED